MCILGLRLAFHLNMGGGRDWIVRGLRKSASLPYDQVLPRGGRGMRLVACQHFRECEDLEAPAVILSGESKLKFLQVLCCECEEHCGLPERSLVLDLL